MKTGEKDIEEKVTAQVSGRVKESQKEDFNKVEGETFSEKLSTLFREYSKRIDTTKFNITTNKNSIIDAFNIVLKNLNNIETNVDAFIKSREIKETTLEVEHLTIKLQDTIKEYLELGKENKKLKDKILNLEEKVKENESIKEQNRLLLIKYSSLLEKKGDI